MNLLLFNKSELIPSDSKEFCSLLLADRRSEHLLRVLSVKPGQKLRAGMINGSTGEVLVDSVSSDEVSLLVNSKDFDTSVKRKGPRLTLLLALPRPQMLKRILQTVSAYGVSELSLVGTKKVEKSFFQSKLLAPGTIETFLVLGLEQAGRTHLPQVKLFKSLKLFFGANSNDSYEKTQKVVAHPRSSIKMPELSVSWDKDLLFAIGPEGGWTDAELESLSENGFMETSISENILKVEQAVGALLAQQELMKELNV